METKIKKVALHLIKYKKITSWDAITKYKATRLGAIIFNLRKKGFIIETKYEIKNKIRFGIYIFKGMKKKK
jgi:hypothetical protein